MSVTPPSDSPAENAGGSGDELARYRLLAQGLDSIALPMHLVDTEYRIIYINQAAATLLGMRKEDALGKRCYDLYRTGNCKTPQCPCRVAMERRTVHRCDNTCGGGIIDCTGAPLTDERGRVVGAIEYFPDVTERRRAVADILRVATEAREGNLKARTETERYTGDIRTLAEGMNGILAAVVEPLEEGMRLAESYAARDYTVRFNEKIRAAGEFSRFKEALNNIGTALSANVTNLNQAIGQLEAGTTEMTKGSDEIAKASEQVAMTSQRCADLAKQVLGRIEAVDHQIADLSASNEEVASTAQDVLERAKKTASRGKEAQGLGNEAGRKMGGVEKIAEQSVAEIENLNAQIREIDKIAKMINDVASQINLLALNAAIEAARAGEHGRGFAVVAGEVRNLAGETKSATRHIEQVIDGIQTSSAKTASSIRSASSEIGSGVESVNQTIGALNEIIAETGAMTRSIAEIAKATEDQATTANQVVQAMSEGTRLTKETQVQMENLAALAEETSASIEEIGSATHELNGMASRLRASTKGIRV
ncbi:PAS domain-containing protein [Methanoculleus sp. Wushi-C6]|uniref:PAS domain-containing protein n=1 Tax=Methanoculleus caldifontis TaxID=2651577 RepID=A0ABU3WYA0_9EURY|nr:methyl-accepting chemotaxis protein [Methanoculleus sp. Wushi-C6]MDV2480761.1 PAS domain-containing protein [Methanoculleus sp. Wushi-C6]